MGISCNIRFFAAAAALAFAAVPAHADPFKLKIACTATSDCASAMVARDEGIFAKHGLDADVTLIGINTNIPPAIVSDSIQIGGPTATVFLQAVDGGLDLVAIEGASVMDPSTDQLVAAVGSQRRDDQGRQGLRRQEGRRARHRRLPARALPQVADREGRRPEERQLRRGDVPDDERRAEVRRGRRGADRRAVRHAHQDRGERRRRRAIRRRSRAHGSDHFLRFDTLLRRTASGRRSRRSAPRSKRPRRSSIPIARRRASRSQSSPRCRSTSCGSTSPAFRSRS